MVNTNDEIEELDNLKHAASERRSKRANSASTKRAASKKSAASAPPAETEEDGQGLPPGSESEELVDKLTGEIETIFGEIGKASRERPVLALVSAFAVGILVGHLLSKRKA
jgi:predicted  nucleic acid-binding Zn-ribbon protein